MKKLLVFLLGTLCSVTLLGQPPSTYKGKYSLDDLDKRPEAPDYGQLDYWVAHPKREDMADQVPGPEKAVDRQTEHEVDVFFIYPTIYTKKQDPEHPWFADVRDEKLNGQIANSTIKYQASVFNGSGKIYAPLYRQAHIAIYYAEMDLRKEALTIAYEDVRSAFIHYLEHENQGRPIIIASHSQGTDHAVTLLNEFFENDESMREKLVAAYIVGMPLKRALFREISPCTSPDQTGCWLTWNTYKKGYHPPFHAYWYSEAFNINPLSWWDNNDYVPHAQNSGGILKNFKKIRPGLTDAQTVDGMLWINKPRFFGNFLINWDRYHVADYNLFYTNIKENVALRVETYLANTK